MNCTKCDTNYIVTHPKFNNNGDTQNYFCSISCDIKLCEVCESKSICLNCTETYILNDDGTGCICPETYITNQEGLCACP